VRSVPDRGTLLGMATAIPLHATGDARPDDLDWAPLDLKQVPADVRAAIEAAQARIDDGSAQIVWQEDAAAVLEGMRRTNGG
jgi:hypothetical protein